MLILLLILHLAEVKVFKLMLVEARDSFGNQVDTYTFGYL